MAPPEKQKAKNQKPTEEEIAAIASDVANFASSIGLAPAHLSSSSGFDDSDFRKSGTIQPPIDFDEDDDDEPVINREPTDAKPKPKPKPKPHPLTLTQPPTNKFENLPKLPLVKASALSGAWYVDADEIEIRVLGDDGRNKKVESVTGVEELEELVRRKKELGERLMMQYVKDYEMGRKKNGDVRLLETTTRSGTSADKVSAFACLVEDNPIANFRALDALLSMVTSKVGKRYAFTGFEALKDMFLLRLLPDRKLKYLIQRPLDKLPETKDGYSLLLFWHWEECLKQRYERFVIALEEALKDMLPSLKDRAMKAVYTLLKSKSEQERRLLSALVNKLGDPERKAASNAAYQLSCLLSAHPNMKAVVIEEVDSFVFRPHIGLRAKYYAVNFLSQIFLTRKGDGPKTAKRLLDLYFGLFKVLISDTVSRDGKKKYNKKDKESGKNNKKHGKDGNEEPHVEMDSRLLSILLTGVNRAFPYVSSDEADDIVETQTPILYRLVHSENFNVSVQALMLLYQISSKNQIASDRFYRALYAKLLTPAAVNSSKPEMFLGLLVKAMRNDINFKRVAAFAKRLLQVALLRPPQYACGCLFMLSEVLKAKPPLWTMVLQKELVDDELEHFTDIVEDPDNVDDPPSNKAISQNENQIAIQKHEIDKNNGLPLKYLNSEMNQESHEGSSLPAGYNPRHREPSFCNADRVSWWELSILASHVHPSVATMAQTLLSGAHIVYNGDPLHDLSLTAFLDKLMEKKPKPNKKAEGRWHGGSQIAPVGKLDMNHHLIGEEILSLAEEDVPPEDIVFHRFYANKTTSKKKSKKKKAQDDGDENDLLASDEEEEIDNASDDDDDEIDDVLGSGVIDDDPSSENYDYDDLDKVIDEDDDDDLINYGVDDVVVNKDDDDDIDDEKAEDDEKEDIGDVMESEDDESASGKKKKKKKDKKGGKDKKKRRASPFVSMEEYEHLMTDGKAGGAGMSKFSKRKRMKKH